jgi:hypothetical protein
MESYKKQKKKRRTWDRSFLQPSSSIGSFPTSHQGCLRLSAENALSKEAFEEYEIMWVEPTTSANYCQWSPLQRQNTSAVIRFPNRSCHDG